MSIKSQGTHVYFVDSITAPATPKLVKFASPAFSDGLRCPKPMSTCETVSFVGKKD